MKTKLTRQEFNGLADLVTGMVKLMPEADLEDKLLKAMMQRLNIEMEKRRVEVKKEYKVNWHPERAIAFASVVQRCTFNHTSFEGNLALRLYNQILQEVGGT